jgi:hypothetical protein
VNQRRADNRPAAAARDIRHGGNAARSPQSSTRSDVDGRAASGPGRGSGLLIAFTLTFAILGDRAQIGIATGGRGQLPLMSIAAPLAALLTMAKYGRRQSLGFVASPTFVFTVLPYLVLTALLPVAGVMFNTYPERTLESISAATNALSFLVLGAAMSNDEEPSWRPWLLLAMTLQVLYAAGQALYTAGAPGGELFAPFHAWDLSLQDLNTFVQGRSSGLYLNPNELGLWAAVTAILGWTVLHSHVRGIAVSLALLTLLLSQSRGASVALAAALVVGIVVSVARGQVASSRTFKSILSFGFAASLAAAAAFLIVPAGALDERFGGLLAVLTEGPGADPNLAGRIDYWTAVLSLNAAYPWGTWGPPELLLGSAIDSTWFSAFAQGSVPYAFTLGLLLLAAAWVSRGPYGRALRVVAVAVAVAGLTQNPFGYPVIVLFWVLLGAALSSPRLGIVAAPLSGRQGAVLPPASRAGASRLP